MEENVEFHIKVSYYEIYMERIRDLLDSGLLFTFLLFYQFTVEPPLYTEPF